MTSPYSSNLQFLHSMRELSYLEKTLNEGFMLTEHEVKFKPITDDNEFIAAFQAKIFPNIERQLRRLGLAWNSLSKDRQQILMMGAGTISGKIPMLCFTEIPEGRVLSTQHVGFGAYGIVVKRSWLEKNRADRVVYVGQNSPVSWAIYCNLVNAKISTIHCDGNGLVVWGQTVEEMQNEWNLLSYVQIRGHLDELEWRIVGEHGFFGGKRENGKYLPIAIDDIDYIFVQREEEILKIKTLVEDVAEKQNTKSIPEILWQPESIAIRS